MKRKLPFLFLFFIVGFSQLVKAQYTIPGNALAFDGSNYVSIPDASNLKTATITLETWVKPNNSIGDIPVVLKLNSRGSGQSNNEAYSIYLTNGKFVAKASSSTGTAASASQTNAYSTGKWYHVAAIFNSTSVSLYVNGVLQQTSTTGFSLNHSTSELRLGGTMDGLLLANFSMDDLKIFSSSRSTQIASDMYQTINAGSNPSLSVYYDFEQGVAGSDNSGITSLTDLTLNANNGTLTNFTLNGASSNWVESYATVIPTVSSASAIVVDGFTANWSTPTNGSVTNYLLEVSTDPTFATFVSGYEDLIVSGTSKSISGLVSNQIYYYRVSADKASVTNQGGHSEIKKVLTATPVPNISYVTPQVFTVSGNAIAPLSPTNTGGTISSGSNDAVSTFAGSGTSGSVNGIAASASFSGPAGLASDGTYIYVADQLNSCIRRISIETGAVTTFAGTAGSGGNSDGVGTAARFITPKGITYDGAGNLYVADYSNHSIRKIEIASGLVTTIAGGIQGNQNGTGTSARFNNPVSVAYDGSGNLYITDQSNYLIRKLVLSTGVVTNFAGGYPGYVNDGIGSAASFNYPYGIAYSAGNLYVTDQGGNRIRKIEISSATVTTIAGNTGGGGFANGIGTAARFSAPTGIVADGSGALYVSDNNNQRIRKILLSTNEVSTLAGNGTSAFVNGSTANASFSAPTGLVLDNKGYLFVADYTNNRIRKIDLSGYSINAQLPSGLSFDNVTGIISGTPTLVTSSANYSITGTNLGGSSTAVLNITVNADLPTITSFSPSSAPAGKKVTITGTNFVNVTGVTFGGTAAASYTVTSATSITAVIGAGTSGNVDVTTVLGTASLAGFTLMLPPVISYNTPNTFISGTPITSLLPTNTGGAVPAVSYGDVSTIAGNSSQGANNATGTSATFYNPIGVATDGTNIYVADQNNNMIRKVVIATGVVSTLAGQGSGASYDGTGSSAYFNIPQGIVYDGKGNLYVADAGNNTIRKIVIATAAVTTIAGNGGYNNPPLDGIGTSAGFYAPNALTYDGTGNLYVTDQNNGSIRKIDLATNTVTTVAGGTGSGYLDATGTAARFSSPMGVAYDNGNLYVCDYQNNRIRKIVLSTGVVTTFAGSGTAAFANGTGTAASFNNPRSIITDERGNLYIGDSQNQRIRKIVISTGEVTTLAGIGSGTFADGNAATATLYPVGLSIFNDYMYFADFGNQRIRKVAISGYNVQPALPAGLSFNNITGEITGTPTAGALAKDYTVTATNEVGSSATPVNIAVTPAAATITSFSPLSVAAGKSIVITGTNFEAVTAVSIGGTDAASYIVNSNTKITAVIGAGASGSVVVTTSAGTATLAGFVLLTQPSISYTTPNIFTVNSLITPLTPTNTGGALGASYAVNTLFGSVSGNIDGNDASATFNTPTDITSDGTNYYVADQLNHKIRKIVIATGQVSTLAGTGNAGSVNATGTAASFNQPTGIVYDGNGNLYVADRVNQRIRKIVIATGVVTTFAGSSSGNLNGTGTSARFSNPTGLAYDGIGNLFVADQSNHRIRQIVISTAAVTTIAGNGIGSSNGNGTSALFNQPYSLTYYNGSLYIADMGNNRIRKMDLTSTAVTYFAGSGTSSSTDANGVSATLWQPYGITSDGTGNLYVSEQGSHKIRKINIATTAVTTLAGTGTSGNVDGAGTTASFNLPTGVFAATSELLIADKSNHRIRSLALYNYLLNTPLPAGLTLNTTTGDITGTPTVASAAADYSISAVNKVGKGTAITNIAVKSMPPTLVSVTPSTQGAGKSVTITGTNLETATAVSFGGVPAASFASSATTISAIVGAGASGDVEVTTTGGTATLAGFTLLATPAFSYNTPNIFTTGTPISAINPVNTGGVVPAVTYSTVTTFAGNGTQANTDAIGINASFNGPYGVATDGTNIYVVDESSARIRKVVIATGQVSTLAGNNSGYADGTGTGASFSSPWGAACDGIGNLYVADRLNHRIRKIVIATGVVTTVAGKSTAGLTDGTGANAAFSYPQGLTYDGNGNLYVADNGNHAIRKIVLATGAVTTIAGAITSGYLDATGTAARFNGPTAVAYENGYLYVTDQSNNKIRKINLSSGAVSTFAGSFNGPTSITAGGDGYLYVADAFNRRIKKVAISNAEVTILAGSGTQSTVDGIGENASFKLPVGVVRSDDFLYVTDVSAHYLRRIQLYGHSISPVLPTGLSLNAASGEISGTPTVGALATDYKVTGFNRAGSYTALVNIAVTPASPTFTSFAPSSAGKDAIVVLNGTNFEAVTGISFGGVAATSFKINSSTSISAIVGSGASGSIELITTGGNASLPGFTFLPGPSISYTSPQTFTVGVPIADLAPVNTGGAVPANAYNVVSDLAGSGTASYADGTGSAASFNNLSGLVSDGTYIYVAEIGNQRIRKIEIATGATITLAGSGSTGSTNATGTAASFNNPSGITTDKNGNLFIADIANNIIRKIVIATGEVTTFAGNGSASTIDGYGTSAYFHTPTGITYDGDGNLYVADYGSHAIRKIVVATGEVTTLAGLNQYNPGYVDGIGTAARFNYPQNLVYNNGNLYVTERGNNRVRRIVVATGEVSTVAGSGTAAFANGIGTAASFYYPQGIAADNRGNLFVADQQNHRIRKISIATGEVSTLAGTGAAGSTNGVGNSATFNEPTGLIFANGSLYVGDRVSQKVRSIGLMGYEVVDALPAGLSLNNSTGVISGTPTQGLLASNYTIKAINSVGNNTTTVNIAITPGLPGLTSFAPTSVGAGKSVVITGINFEAVTGVTFGGTAAASFAVSSPTSIVATVATGNSGDVVVTTTAGTATLSGFTYLLGPAITYGGPYTYNADGSAITTVTPTHTGGAVPAISYGTVSTLAGTGASGGTNGAGVSSTFSDPGSVASDGVTLYVTEKTGHRIRKISILTGAVSTLAGSGSAAYADGTGTDASFSSPMGIVYDGNGNLYVVDRANHKIRKVVIASGVVTTLAGSSFGSADGIGTNATFYNPSGLVYDGSGNLYVTESTNNIIRKIVISTGAVTTIAGTAGSGSFADGTGSAARFNDPAGITYDNGNLYITERSNNRIRKLVLSTGVVTTLAGNASSSFANGTGPSASFFNPSGICADGEGNLYVSDQNNSCVRKIVIATAEVSTFAGIPTAGGAVDGSAATSSFNRPSNLVLESGYLYVSDESNNKIRKIALVGYQLSPALPLGLSFNDLTGTISGTPTTGNLASNYSIKATNAAGNSTAVVNIAVVPGAPTITSFTPSGVGAGQTVTITGTKLEAVTNVSFGGIAAASFTMISPTMLTAVTGAGTSGDIVVTTTGGTATKSGFTLLTPPVLSYAGPQTYATNTLITPLLPVNTGGAVPTSLVGAVSTLAGNTNYQTGFSDNTGTAALFSSPWGLVSDGTNIYVADRSNNRIRKIVMATKAVSTLAGQGGQASIDGTGTSAYFNLPTGIAYDGNGNLYVADQGGNRIRKIVTATGVVSTIAGSGSANSIDGTGTSASFNSPASIALDGTGNLYVADYISSNIRKIVIATGVVSTVSTGFSQPHSIVYYNGGLYISEFGDNKVKKLDLTTFVKTVVAGSGAGYADGIGTAASFGSYLNDLLSDGEGNLYVADVDNKRIRKVQLSTGRVTTVSGRGNAGRNDGDVETASFANVFGMALVGKSLYVTDDYSIRTVDLTGYHVSPALPTGLSLTTNGSIIGTPAAIKADETYTVLATNLAGSSSATVNIRVIYPSPVISSMLPVVAGTGHTITLFGSGFTGTTAVTIGGTPATSFKVLSENLIAAVVGSGTSGSVGITAPGGSTTIAGFTFSTAPAITYTSPLTLSLGTAINPHTVTNTGGAIPSAVFSQTSTIAGSSNGNIDAAGTSAKFNRPYGITSDGAGNLYVADYYNHLIRKVAVSTGTVTTIAGTGSAGFTEGTGTSASFNYPSGITYNDGYLYIADQLNHRIRKMELTTGVVSTFSGSGTEGYADGGSGQTNFNNPISITTDGANNLYVADLNNGRIRKLSISGSGSSTTLAGNSSFGYSDGTGAAATFNYPSGIAYDSGNLYITDQNNNRIRKVVIATGVVSTLAGSGAASSANGTGTSAGFKTPASISADGIGNLYLTDQGNNKIRKIAISTSAVTTLSGTGTTGVADGTGSASTFNSPSGIYADHMGNLFVSDQANHRIRKIIITGYEAASLPAGLTIDAATGTLSGTPTALSSATSYIINGTNTIGSSTANISINVIPALPAITSFTPVSAKTGTEITINGTDFTGATAVTFGGTAATSYTVVSPTKITAIVAAGTTGNVEVTTASGTGSLAGFTYLSSNANLAGISLSTGSIAPTFDASTLTYTASVASTESSITLTPTAAQAQANIKVNNTAVVSGAASSPITLGFGNNPITVLVTAEDGVTTKTYTVTVNRGASTNADLAGLSVSTGTLSPVFASVTTGYAVSVGNSTTSIKVTPTATSASSTIKVNGVILASATQSGSLPLGVGVNTIAIDVTAEDGTTLKSYTVDVTRASSVNANLANLIISSGTLSPAFAANTIGYTASVGNSVTSLTVTPVVSDNNSTVTVNGELIENGSSSTAVTLTLGDNVITTVVTAQNGTTTKTYTTTVNRVSASQSITFAALAAKTYGDGDFSLTATGGASGNTVTFASSNTAVATVSGNTVTIVGAGSTTITASQAGDASYSAATDVPQTLIVGKAAASITLSNLTQTYDGNAKSATATTSPASLSGVSITYDGSATTPSAVGTYAVAASLNNGNYTSLNATGTLTINKISQIITFAALSAKTYGDAAFSLTATGGGSGSTLTYASSNTSVATISGSTVTIVGAGSTTITASQTGNGNYTAATDVPQTLTVNKATATLTLSNLVQGYDGTAKTVTVTTSPVNLSGVSITYDGSATAPSATASYAVVANLTNDNYAATAATGTLEIGKTPQTITFAALSAKTYGDADFSLTASGGASGNTVTFTSSNTAVATVSGTTVTIVGAGSTTITASQAGDATYAAATNVPQTLTVNKASAIITLSNLTQTYNGSAKSATATTSPANLTGVSITYDASATAPSNAGTYAVVASLTNANYTATNATGNLVIGKLSQIITFAALSAKTYGDAAFSLTATGGGSNGTISYTSSNTSVATVSGSTVTIVGAGSTTITASQAGNGNYTAATDVAQTLTVNKATATITLSNLAQAYDGTAKTVTATTSPANLTGVSITYDGSATVPSATASYAVVATLTNNNYTATDATGTLEIGKTPQTISFAALSAKTYGDADFSLSATGGASGNTVTFASSNTAVATVSGTTVAIVGAGSTNITASQTGDATYSAAANVPQTLTINKAIATITLSNLTQTYDGNAKSATATTAPASLSGVSITYDGSATALSDAGTYAVVASLTNAKYAATNATGNLVIGKLSQTITFAALSAKTYGDAAFSLTATGGGSGSTLTYASSNTSVATISGSTVTIVGAGSTTITASQSGSANYTAATDVQQTITVNKATATLTLSNLVQGYDGTAKTVTVTTSPVNLSGVSITYDGSATAPSATASYAVVANLTNDNYAATAATGTLEIGKTPQTITFAALSAKTYGDADFSLTASGGASGNTVTFTSSNTAVATVSGTTVTIVGAGSTTITASQAGDATYAAATNVPQTLTVNKASAIITLSNLTQTYNGSAKSATATTSPANLTGVSITYDASATAPSNAGTYAVVASLTNANYTATNATGNLVIGKLSQIITFAALSAKTYGDAAFSLTATGGGSNGTISYTSSNTSVATVSGSTVTIVGAGSTTITASQAGNGNYTAATDVAQTLTVNKATATITLSNLAQAYDGTAKTVTATTSPANLGGVSVTYNGSSTVPSAGGTYAIIADLNNANYAAINATGSLVIGKTAQVITFSALSAKTYGDAAFNLTATGGGSANALIYVSSNTSVATISGNTVTIIGAGSTTITASQSGNSNYAAATDAQQVLTVNKANPVIAAYAGLTKTYGDAAFALTAPVSNSSGSFTYTSGTPSVAGISGSTVTVVSAGSTLITALQAATANYNTASISFSVAVNKAALNITAIDLTKTYSGIASTGGNGVTYSGFIGSDNASNSLNGTLAYTGTSQGALNAGTYVLTPSGYTSANYIITYSVGNLLIGKASLAVTPDNKAKIQGAVNPLLTVSYSGFVNNETSSMLSSQPILTTTANTSSAVGNYLITASAASAANYNISYTSGILSITAFYTNAPTDISLSKISIDENNSFGAIVGTLGSIDVDPGDTFNYALVNGTGSTDNNNFSLTGNQLKAGSAFDFETKSSYSIRVRTTDNGGLSFEKAFVISVNDINEAPTLNAISNQNLCYTVSEQVISLSGISAGPETSQTTTLAVSSSNNALFSNLQVTAGANGTAELKYTPAGSASGTVTVTVAVTDNGGALSGGTDRFTRSFTITLNPIPVISISSNKGLVVNKKDVLELTATGGDSYSWSNAEGIKSGQNSVTLTIAPEKNTKYKVTVTTASGCISVQEIEITVMEAANIMTPNGDGVNDQWIVKNIDKFPNNEVKVFDRAGRLIFTKKGYTNSWDATIKGSPLAEGTYYYVVDLGNGGTKLVGFISIVRQQ